MQKAALALRAQGRTIGFVPTMGYLHDGHASLMRIARARADVVVASIFVNPTQFGPQEDLNKYPRDFERDEIICRGEKADIIFYPTPENMYLPDHSVYVAEEKLSSGLCGASRPGHFRGVATVVAKLINIVQPSFVVLGEKDAQQLRVLKRMVRDLNFPVEIVPGPTVREPDGLAMSSRNKYLSSDERRQAVCLRHALNRATELYRSGTRDAESLCDAMIEVIGKCPSAKIDYIDLVDDSTLEPVRTLNKPTLVALAVYVGKTRLIDNITLDTRT